jgi:hypothetical protein
LRQTEREAQFLERARDPLVSHEGPRCDHGDNYDRYPRVGSHPHRAEVQLVAHDHVNSGQQLPERLRRLERSVTGEMVRYNRDFCISIDRE